MVSEWVAVSRLKIVMALFLEGRIEWILGPVRQILPSYKSGFLKLAFSMEPLSSNEIADTIRGNQHIWGALIDGWLLYLDPSQFSPHVLCNSLRGILKDP